MSKRGQEFQGGDDRYGGSGGTETPADTPARATAAQMANRRIATMKGRKARSTSPTKTMGSGFGGFEQQNGAVSSNGINGFGQGSSGMSNGFSFGQPQQQSSTSGFTFGQSQPPAATASFTFGQPATSQNGAFTFGGSNAAQSFPPAASTPSNPFSTNGTSTAAATNGFTGNIFSFGSNTNSSQPTTTGFSFNSAPSTAPTSPGQPPSPTSEAKQAIADREKFMSTAEQERLEEIVGSYLPESPNGYQKDPFEYIPADILQQAFDFVQSLQRPSFGAVEVVQTLFTKPYRPKTKREWLTDVQRQEIKQAATKLSASEQSELAQIAKDSVESLKSKADNELPAVENLPNDVQHKMLDFVRQAASEPAKPAQQPVDVENEAPRSNPFAAIKPATPAQTPKQTPTFSFGSVAKAQPPATPKAAPVFNFGQPATAISSSEPTMPITDAQETAVEKPNPSGKIARPTSTPPMQPSANTPSQMNAATAKPVSSGFSFGGAQPTAPVTSSFTNTSTPAKPAFSFAGPALLGQPQTSSMPGVGGENGNFGRSASNPTSATPRNIFSAPAEPSPPTTSVAAPTKTTSSTAATLRSPNDSSQDGFPIPARLQALNVAFRKALSDLPSNADWTPFVKAYITQMEKLRQTAIMNKTDPQSTQVPPRANQDISPSTPHKRPANSITTMAQSPEKAEDVPFERAKSRPGFQLASTGKPLTATASLFSNILDSPERSSEITPRSQSQVLATPTAAFTFKPAAQASLDSSSPSAPTFSFQPATASAAAPPQAASAPMFQIPNSTPTVAVQAPKFGGSGGTPNFMSAFGAQAAKEAEKAKAKRKAEDFDSDEDDEEEWERQDRAKQEEKKRAMEHVAKKVMKMVNGKYEWVDVEEDAPAAATTSKPAEKVSVSVDDTSTKPPGAFFNPFGHLTQGTTNGIAHERDDDEDTDEDDDDATTETAAPAKEAGGLFDRIDARQAEENQSSNAANSTKPTFSFGSTSPAGDQTWKPETPIKFGATSNNTSSTTPSGSPAKPLFSFSQPSTVGQPPASVPPKFSFGTTNTTSESAKTAPKFSFGTPSTSTIGQNGVNEKSSGSIFGTKSSAPSTTGISLFANLKPSSDGTSFKFGGGSQSSTSNAPSIFGGGSQPSKSNAPSIFGSQPTTRASTPGGGGGATTNTEDTPAASDNDDDAAPPEAQQDLTALSAEEQRTEDVLFEQKARCRKFHRGQDAQASWETKGIGIVRLMRSKGDTTASARVLMRLSPGGTVVINNRVLKQKSMYGLAGEKAVKLVFAEQGGGLSTFTVSFGTAEKAKDLLDAILGTIED